MCSEHLCRYIISFFFHFYQKNLLKIRYYLIILFVTIHILLSYFEGIVFIIQSFIIKMKPLLKRTHRQDNL